MAPFHRPTGMIVIILLLAGACGALAEDGSGPSRWGPIPAHDDSVATEAQNVPKPLWEKSLYYPYRLIVLPLQLVYVGSEAVGTAAYKSGVITQGAKLFKPFEGPWGTTIGKNFTFGGLRGYGGGLSVTHPGFLPTGGKFKLRLQYTTKNFSEVTLGLRLHKTDSSLFDLGFGYRNQPNTRYFGTGPLTNENDQSFFTQEMTWFGGNYRYEPANDFFIEMSGMYSSVGTRGPGEPEDNVPLEDVFAVRPVGYGERSNGLSFGLSLGHDSTDQVGRPADGGVQRVRTTYFMDNDDTNTRFWELRGEIQQFFSPFSPRRTLAFRAHISWLENKGDNAIPFQRLMVNDDPDLLRGYQDYRWRDLGMTAATVEYRWPIFARNTPDGYGLDSYLFTDFGQVFDDLDQLNTTDMTTSYGFGLRFVIPGGGFVGRLEIARSEEETVIRLRGDQLFQFAKGGLLHGRNPIPSR